MQGGVGTHASNERAVVNNKGGQPQHGHNQHRHIAEVSTNGCQLLLHRQPNNNGATLAQLQAVPAFTPFGMGLCWRVS